MYSTQNGDCPLVCGYKTPYGKCGVTACINRNFCPTCGGITSVIYNAGMPVWACERCRSNTRIIYSNDTKTQEMEVKLYG